MRPSLLSAVPALDGRTLQELEALAIGAGRLALRRGDILVQQGEPSDALYFVLSGRFTVHVEGATGPIAEIGQGEPVGEIGFFAGLPRTATVVALRDSTVLGLTRERFQEISESAPKIRDAVVLSLARRLAANVNQVARNPGLVRTVAIVPAGASHPSPPFLDALRDVFAAASRTVFLTEQELTARFPAAPLDDPTTSSWLNSVEAESDFIFYVADETLTDWTRKCIRQADALLLVAAAGAVGDAVTALAVLVGAIVVFSLAECLYDAVHSPLVSDLAPPELLARYLAVTAFSWQVGFIVGPAVGALVLAAAPTTLWLVAAAICAAASVYSLRLSRHLPDRVRRTPRRPEPPLVEVAAEPSR